MILFKDTRVVDGSVEGFPCAGPITSPFGARDMEAHASGHTGVDIGAAAGTPVKAPCRAFVRDVFIDARRGTPWDAFKDVFGNAVILEHSGYVTIYAHLRDTPVVVEGQTVEAGDLLGVVGSTGTSTGPHLHWGMAPALEQGQPSYLPRHATVDPLGFIGGPEDAFDRVEARKVLRAMEENLREFRALIG